MHLIHPADELVDIRAEIARLRAREAELRALILASPQMAQGRWFRAEVVERRARHLNPAALPQSIRDDPFYWHDRLTRSVTCVAVQQRLAPRPGWPIHRGAEPGMPPARQAASGAAGLH
jgi:hypothetical protein